MLEIFRKYIINKRTRVINKKSISKKSNNNNDKLFYSIKSFGSKNQNKIFYVINRSPGGGMFSNLNFVILKLFQNLILICSFCLDAKRTKKPSSSRGIFHPEKAR